MAGVVEAAVDSSGNRLEDYMELGFEAGKEMGWVGTAFVAVAVAVAEDMILLDSGIVLEGNMQEAVG
jgi:hypothetical protein